jgi:hypothetical protein
MDLVQGESNDIVIYEITPYAAASSNSPPACGFFYEQAGQAGVWIVTGLIAGMQDPDKSDQDQGRTSHAARFAPRLMDRHAATFEPSSFSEREVFC